MTCPACGHPDLHEPRTASLSSGKCPKCSCLSGWMPATPLRPNVIIGSRERVELIGRIVSGELLPQLLDEMRDAAANGSDNAVVQALMERVHEAAGLPPPRKKNADDPETLDLFGGK